MIFWAKYNTQTTFSFPMVKRGVVDLAVTADWTPAAADSAISKDQGSFADTSNTVAIVGGSPTRGATGWKLVLTATELSCAQADVQIVDAATKAVEDQFLTIYTYGNASAKVVADLSDAVRLGLTALPNAAAEAAGGLYTRGSGAGQINQPGNGLVDVSLKAILNTTLTETAGLIAGGFKKFFNVGSPTGTLNDLPGVAPGQNGGLALGTDASGNVGANVTKFGGTALTASGGRPEVNMTHIAGAAVATGTAQIGVNVVAINSQTATAAAGVTFPASIASPTNITAGTITTATNLTTNNDKTGYALSNGGVDAIFIRAMVEAYSTKGGTLTLAQFVHEVMALLTEFGISGTTLTTKKRDQAITAETFTLDSATAPSAITRAT